MKSYQFKNSSKKETEKTTVWEAFTNHLDSIYFPGATELLDKQLVAFEFEQFKECYV